MGKIRQGFVSNSSSSSFVLVVKKDTYDEILSGMCPLDRALAEKVMYADVVLGQECMIFNYFSDQGGQGSCSDFDCAPVIARAKQLSEEQGVPIMPGDDNVDEDELREIINESLYDVRSDFNKSELIKQGKVWTHDTDF